MRNHRSIPENQYAVVKDIERGHIVFSGTYGECFNEANLLNRVYQSTAYRAERWKQ